jgi:hypothetical protein
MARWLLKIEFVRTTVLSESAVQKVLMGHTALHISAIWLSMWGNADYLQQDFTGELQRAGHF